MPCFQRSGAVFVLAALSHAGFVAPNRVPTCRALPLPHRPGNRPGRGSWPADFHRSDVAGPLLRATEAAASNEGYWKSFTSSVTALHSLVSTQRPMTSNKAQA